MKFKLYQFKRKYKLSNAEVITIAAIGYIKLFINTETGDEYCKFPNKSIELLEKCINDIRTIRVKLPEVETSEQPLDSKIIRKLLTQKRKKYTQKGLADRLGVAQSYISMILNGDRKVNSLTAKKIKKEISKL